MGIAVNGRPLDVSLDRLPRLREAQARWERAEGKVRIGPLHVGPRDLLAALARDLPRIARDRVRR